MKRDWVYYCMRGGAEWEAFIAENVCFALHSKFART